MKKLLVLTLVLGLASLASAALTLSVNGQVAPDEITINISDTVTIDLMAGAENVDAFVDTYWEANGNFEILNVREGDVEAQGDFQFYIDGPVPYNGALSIGVKSAWGPETPKVAGTLMLFDLHCLGEGDVYIELFDAAGGSVADSLTIHQVPEPATMALLGLGALVLRRKK
jgi:hypothetical protein